MNRDFDKEPTNAKERDCATYGHCWHVSREQHTIGSHRDDVCCWCRKGRCVSFIATRPTIQDGEPHRSHGHFGIGEEIGWEKPGSTEPEPVVVGIAPDSFPPSLIHVCKICDEEWIPLPDRTAAERMQLLRAWAKRHEHP